MKNAILFGATGLTGRLLLLKLLDDPYYQKITVFVRSNIAIQHPKLIEIIINFDELYKERIEGDDIYCCLGTTIKKAGSKEKFKLVDYTYCLNIAKIAKKYNSTQFLIITSLSSKNSMFYYLKIKQLLENDLKNLKFNSLIIFKPSYLLGKRENDFRFFDNVSQLLFTMFSFFVPKKYKAIKAEKVANGMIHFAKQNYSGVREIESDVLQDF